MQARSPFVVSYLGSVAAYAPRILRLSLLSNWHIGHESIEYRQRGEPRPEYGKEVIDVEVYDAMNEAAKSGKPNRTRLDPPLADARAAHDTSTLPAWAKRGNS